MARFLKIALLLIFFCESHLAAITPLQIEQTAKSFLGQNEEEGTAANLENLSSDWWSYYETVDKNYSQKVRDTKKNLDNFLPSLTVEDLPHAEASIQRILASMKAYQSLSLFQVEPREKEHRLRRSYSIDYYVQYMQSLKEISDEKGSNENIQNSLKAKIRNIKRRNNDLFANYLEESSPDKRILLALEIIASRFNQAVKSQELRIHEDKLAQIQEARDEISEALLHVKENLDLLSFDHLNYQSAIAWQEKRILEAEEKLAETENFLLRSFSANGDDSLSRALWNQKVITQSIEVAILKTERLKTKIKKAVAEFANESIQQDTQKVQQTIQNWKNNLEEWNIEQENWRRATEIEKDKTHQDYVRLIEENPQKTESKANSLYQERNNETLLSSEKLAALERMMYSCQLLLKFYSGQVSEKSPTIELWYGTASITMTQGWESLKDWSFSSLFSVGGIPITPFSIARFFFIILFTFWFSSFTRKGLARISTTIELQESAYYVFSKLLHYLILTVGATISLSSIGMELGNLALIAGALSLGIGFGLQNVFNNFVCGLIILFERNLKVGDYVETHDGLVGRVSEVNIQNTVLHTFDGTDILIPNSQLIGNKITNWTLRDSHRRIHLPFGVAYGTDKEKVRDVITQVALKSPFTARLPTLTPQVWFTGFGDSSLNFELLVWVNIRQYPKINRISSEYLWAMETALRENDIVIPFPQRDIHVIPPQEVVSKKGS